MRSMVTYLFDCGERRDIHLIYAASHADELAFLPLFTQYHLQLTTVVKKPHPGYAGLTGSISPARILDIAGDNGRSYLYFSGPEPMVEAFYKEFKASGIDADRLITDYFSGYTSF
jgi:ferredoxin-NADP reductase